jgi:hypothetical protein
MGYNPEPTIKAFNKLMDIVIKSELKTTRKRNGRWFSIENHGLPSQARRGRFIKPRGKQVEFNNGKVYTYIPTYENGKYFWK